MLPAAKWVIAAAITAPVAIAAVSPATGVDVPTGDPSVSASTSPTADTSPSISPSPSVETSPSVDSSPSVQASPSADNSIPAPAETLPNPPQTPAPEMTVTAEMAMESSLAALGLPTGKVDGVIDTRTRRAVCAYRDVHGLPASRRLPNPRLMDRIAASTELPELPKRLSGVKALVSLTCQTAIITDNAGGIVRVLPVSTGKDDSYHETRTGFKRVYYRVNAWQASTLFPEPDGRPGLYRPIYFDRGIAFHGVRKPIRTFPQSHGCVRTWPKHQDWLWKRLGLRDRVFVYGNYWKGTTASLGGYGR